jgi:hypothetical protein
MRASADFFSTYLQKLRAFDWRVSDNSGKASERHQTKLSQGQPLVFLNVFEVGSSVLSHKMPPDFQAKSSAMPQVAWNLQFSTKPKTRILTKSRSGQVCPHQLKNHPAATFQGVGWTCGQPGASLCVLLAFLMGLLKPATKHSF